MATVGTPVCPAVEVFQFTGSNSTDLFAYVQNYCSGAGANVGAAWVSGTVDGAGNAAMNLGSYGWLTIYPGDYAMVTGCNINVCGASDLATSYRSLAPVIALGFGDIPTGVLLAGGTRTVTVNLSPAFVDASFTAKAVIVGAGLTLLGQLEVTSVTIVSRSQVSCVVTNKALVSVTVSAGSVEVTAQHA